MHVHAHVHSLEPRMSGAAPAEAAAATARTATSETSGASMLTKLAAGFGGAR